MSEHPQDPQTELEKAAKELFDFAIEREDVKWLMANLAKEADINRTTVEYELQILKIITTGWSISFFLEDNPVRHSLAELFWKDVFEFSKSLSETTGLMIGQQIDYFNILKQRLDMYVMAMAQHSGEIEPAEVMGPEFAKTCGNPDDIFTSLTGTKMFTSTAVQVRKYLESLESI